MPENQGQGHFKVKLWPFKVSQEHKFPCHLLRHIEYYLNLVISHCAPTVPLGPFLLVTTHMCLADNCRIVSWSTGWNFWQKVHQQRKYRRMRSLMPYIFRWKEYIIKNQTFYSPPRCNTLVQFCQEQHGQFIFLLAYRMWVQFRGYINVLMHGRSPESCIEKTTVSENKSLPEKSCECVYGRWQGQNTIRRARLASANWCRPSIAPLHSTLIMITGPYSLWNIYPSCKICIDLVHYWITTFFQFHGLMFVTIVTLFISP